LKEERAMLLEEWINKEVGFGDLGDVSLVQKKAPRKVKRKRPIPTEDGSTIAYALYSVFPFNTSRKVCNIYLFPFFSWSNGIYVLT
jgi:crooked neck